MSHVDPNSLSAVRGRERSILGIRECHSTKRISWVYLDSDSVFCLIWYQGYFWNHIPSGYVKIAIENSHRNCELFHQKRWIFPYSFCKQDLTAGVTGVQTNSCFCHFAGKGNSNQCHNLKKFSTPLRFCVFSESFLVTKSHGICWNDTYSRMQICWHQTWWKEATEGPLTNGFLLHSDMFFWDGIWLWWNRIENQNHVYYISIYWMVRP